jgi:protein involved in polysaccharide export with SLBB domain
LNRLNEDEITTTVIPFNLGELLADVSHDISLHPRDRVIVYSTEVTEVKDRVVSIHGEVKKPGSYALKDTMSLMDLIMEAGGFTEGADTVQAEVSRLRREGLKGDSLAMILQVALTKDFSQNEVALSDPAKKFLLRHRDQVLIRPNPDYRLQQTVTVEGEFTYPGVYSIKRKGEKLSEILTRAGGPTTISYMGGAQYYRNGVRLVVDLERAFYEKDPDNDIIVLGGDRIFVPQRPRTVLVTGEVNNPGLYSFIKAGTVSDYLDRAGEVTDSADYALLTLPTGETKKVGLGLFSRNPKVLEGSSIRVLKQPAEPVEEKKIDWGGTIKDVFAITASAATIIYLVSQVKK